MLFNKLLEDLAMVIRQEKQVREINRKETSLTAEVTIREPRKRKEIY